MAWNEDRARVRILGFINSVPQGDIKVEDFAAFLMERRVEKGVFAADAAKAALVDIPRNRAITTDGVHVYANLIAFNSVLTDQERRETEASHIRALEFLHAHYSACDALIDGFDMQRVDFHGARLHAVVLQPEGKENEAERVRIAVGFAAAFREMVHRLGEKHQRFQTEVRVGVDSGPAVAIDSGKSGEREPLFIGSPANHAAKLADGSDPGLFLSKRTALLLEQPVDVYTRSVLLNEELERRFLNDVGPASKLRKSASARLEDAYSAVIPALDERVLSSNHDPVFKFHRKEPPLKDIVYEEHPPSNAIRMELASIFADVDNFTAYIDNAIQTGKIAEAVANLHVIRAEMGAVLKADFGGRKVRYIGDCIHGLLAEGDRFATNERETVKKAIETAAALRSSFELCRTMLPGAQDLGLAIGIEYGVTPICRLGLRGLESVRAATSKATCLSEEEQRRCNGDETAIGEKAFQALNQTYKEAFGPERIITGLDVDTAGPIFGEVASLYIISAPAAEPLRAHSPAEAEPMRAHCCR